MPKALSMPSKVEQEATDSELTVDSKLWEQLPGEPNHVYDIFKIYRELGPYREVAVAVRIYLSQEIDQKAALKRWGAEPVQRVEKQQAIYRKHRSPENYATRLTEVWKRNYAIKWRWAERVDAYDAWQEILLVQQNDEKVLAARRAEAESLRKWRVQQLEGHMLVQQAGIAIVRRLIQLAEQGKLAEMSFSRNRQVLKVALGRDGFELTEVVEPGLIDLLPIALKALESGQTMEQKDRGEPTEFLRVEGTEAALLEAVVQGLKQFVPEDKVDEAADYFERIAGDIRRSAKEKVPA